MSVNFSNRQRKSIRLKEYDYGQPGAYFVTLCLKDRECLFGDICDDKMNIHNAGKMVEKWWHELTRKFSSVEIDEYIVMPNHFHGILLVGAALCGRPMPENGHPHRDAPTLSEMVGWFKSMTTNEYIQRVKKEQWPPFNGKLWQRNFYEHIIRSEDEMNIIRQYIIDNPKNWLDDCENICKISN